jgi:hypothetical protein
MLAKPKFENPVKAPGQDKAGNRFQILQLQQEVRSRAVQILTSTTPTESGNLMITRSIPSQIEVAFEDRRFG